MERNAGPSDVKVRTYFLQQGNAIHKLHSVLGSGILAHHLKKWFSLLLELILYLFFILVIILSIIMPDNPLEALIKINDTTELQIALRSDEVLAFFFVLKVLMCFFSLPFLGMALLLGRHRRKNSLIRQASLEVEQMREDFEKALAELKL